MEMRTDSPVWLDEFHPNFTRWQRARELSIERGKLVQSITNQVVKAEGLKILDLGSGEGGTTKVFLKNNFVVSFDLSYNRLQRQKDHPGSTIGMTGVKFVNGNTLHLPFLENFFDLIIIQDVIEHLTDIQVFYEEIKRVLKQNGTIYLSTPNKLSIINFISDPHFGLPVISILKRDTIKKYFLRYFRKKDYYRNDIAQLLSLKEITKLFGNDFKVRLNSKFVISELIKGNKGIVWSNFHLKLNNLVKSIGLDYLLNKISNDKPGIMNKIFTPTFYLLLTRKI
jgi:ubiquinone/menaquinone biosynthesis C-methylase UbiE